MSRSSDRSRHPPVFISVPVVSATANGHDVPGDANGDNRTDLCDATLLQACLPPEGSISVGCEALDLGGGLTLQPSITANSLILEVDGP